MHRKTQKRVFVISFLMVGLLVTLVGCAGTKSANRARDASTPAPTSKAKPLTATDLAKLRWIEGTWRGTGDVEAPFYERYHFENESTLVVESFDDETLSKINDVTRFELKDGQFGNSGEGSRWTATELNDDSVTFTPVARAKNSFRWQKESEGKWKAILDWPSTETSPSRQRVYLMERWPLVK
jgi:hypothetical protein